jgi:hypothetical protein
MTDTVLHCPNCGHAIPLTEALSAQLRSELEASLVAEHKTQIAEAEARARHGVQQAFDDQIAGLKADLDAHAQRAREAQARELELRRRALELEETQHTVAERVRIELEDKLRREADERAEKLAAEAATRARAETALELKLAGERLAEQQRQIEAAQQTELALRQQAEAIESRARGLDLELARKLDAKKAEWEAQMRQLLGDEQALKLREKEKQIDDLRRVIDDLKRKSAQGSQELQGEVLELDIQAALEALFPHDAIRPGMQGADLIQEVRNAALALCGTIVWEVKNTRHWQPAWIAKLKDDQRACGAGLAVLVSVALPEGVRGFAQINGVWVAGLDTWPALAAALREQLTQVAFARNAATGMNEKMEALYRYLAGDAFRHKVEAIVEAFTMLREQLDRERRAMEKLWREREKQLERIIGSTAGMYGELRGTIGQAMQPIASLELDDGILPPAPASLPGGTV